MSGTSNSIVDPELYTETYYLTDNEGFREYALGVNDHVHEKYSRALRRARLKPGMRVLDIGCGRGEISFHAAGAGCFVTALDYSEAAVKLCRKTVEQLPRELRKNVSIKQADVTQLAALFGALPEKEKFDAVFMVDFVEHVYPRQLKQIVSDLRTLMKSGGLIFISTPNRWYEQYFYGVKKLIEWPFTFLKMSSRLVRGKIKPDEFWAKVNHFSLHRNDLIDHMHINVMSPSDVKKYFKGWQVDLECADHSRHLLSILLKPWFGREILACARPAK